MPCTLFFWWAVSAMSFVQVGFTLLFLGWGNPWDSPSASSCCRCFLRCRRIHPSIWFYSFKCFVFQKPPGNGKFMYYPTNPYTITNPIVYDPQWLVPPVKKYHGLPPGRRSRAVLWATSAWWSSAPKRSKSLRTWRQRSGKSRRATADVGYLWDLAKKNGGFMSLMGCWCGFIGFWSALYNVFSMML